MLDIFKIFAALASGYLLGSLNTALIVGRLYGTDVRSQGSKSAGLTNALRVLGKPAAALVLAGDILKGLIACLIGLRLGVYVRSGQAVDCIGLLVAGTAAVIGHNWPVYFGFKGGKGALTAITVRLGHGPHMPRRFCDCDRLNPVCFLGHDMRRDAFHGDFIRACLRAHHLLFHIDVPDCAYNYFQTSGKHKKAAVRYGKQTRFLIVPVCTFPLDAANMVPA